MLPAQCLIDPHQISLHEQIGTGGFGRVFRGEWRGTEVAVKQHLLHRRDEREPLEDELVRAIQAEVRAHPPARNPPFTLTRSSLTLTLLFF